jgi:hypothetical protein
MATETLAEGVNLRPVSWCFVCRHSAMLCICGCPTTPAKKRRRRRHPLQLELFGGEGDRCTTCGRFIDDCGCP